MDESEGRIGVRVGSEGNLGSHRLEVEKFVEELTEIKSGLVEVHVDDVVSELSGLSRDLEHVSLKVFPETINVVCESLELGEVGFGMLGSVNPSLIAVLNDRGHQTERLHDAIEVVEALDLHPLVDGSRDVVGKGKLGLSARSGVGNKFSNL